MAKSTVCRSNKHWIVRAVDESQSVGVAGSRGTVVDVDATRRERGMTRERTSCSVQVQEVDVCLLKFIKLRDLHRDDLKTIVSVQNFRFAEYRNRNRIIRINPDIVLNISLHLPIFQTIDFDFYA